MSENLGLPAGTRACLFDLDGVLTSTATVHAAAWKEAFDEFLHEYAEADGPPFQEFSVAKDYPAYVDGKTRLDGVRSFLESRGIELPEGADDDDPSKHTVAGIGNRKQGLLLDVVRRNGVQPYPGAVRYLEAAKEAGLHRAVVSSSENCQAFVEAAGIDGLLEVRVDGVTVRERGLRGKPAPDAFLAAAEELGVEPELAAVFEDALAGVQAGRDGGFGYVVGVDRADQAEALKEHGASVTVKDIGDLL